MAYPVATTADSLASAAEHVLGKPVSQVRILKQQPRLYSSIWVLDVLTDVDSQKVVAKTWADESAFRMQLNAITQARASFAGRDDICIPYLGQCEEQHLLLMEYVEDQSLSELLKLSPGILQALNLRRWRDNLNWACFATGRWLREWHTISRGREPLAPLLNAYLEKRHDSGLALLDTATQQRLQTLIDGLGNESICATHGDFTPQNIMWSERKLTVLDLGISEWHQMSPCWDCAIMEIGLTRELKFSLKSPGKWFPILARAAVDAFWRGYGEPDGSPQAYKACTALRHWVLYANDATAGSAYHKRANWHHSQLLATLR